MVPGDLIEWVYDGTDIPVACNEEVYSSTMKTYVPVGSDMVHMLMHRDGETYYWLNQMGLFYAGEDDLYTRLLNDSYEKVALRVRVVLCQDRIYWRYETRRRDISQTHKIW